MNYTKQDDWTNGNYIPDRDGYYLCRVGGIPFTDYAVCKIEGDDWLIWIYFNLEIQGWCGFKKDWYIKEYMLIEDKL